MHLFLRQVLSRGHSEFKMHSGRQASYGLPMYSGRHSQSPFLQIAFGPHGDGLHGSLTVGIVAKRRINLDTLIYKFFLHDRVNTELI